MSPPSTAARRRPWRLLPCLWILGAGAWLAEAAVAAAPPPLEELLVTGERPGPGMWRVSKGGHDLWILATLEPLPKNMIWRSQAVEARIASSAVVLAPPRVDPKLGFWRGLTLLPAALRARRTPDGQTLEQELPHDLYIRWLALRVKYLGSGGYDERVRPLLAAFDLYTHTIDQSGLTADDSVWTIVERTARKHHVPILPVTLELPIDDPEGALRELAKIPRESEVACLQTTIARIETDLEPMRQRANLWSLGDIEGLQAMHYADERITCLDAFFSVPPLRDQFQRADMRLKDMWFVAAARALDQHETSLAVLPITLLLGADGRLARLRAAGFSVQEPR